MFWMVLSPNRRRNSRQRLVLQKDEEGKINISFDFSANEPQVVEGIKCPSCGGDIVTTAYGFRCIHYDREKEDSCDFSVGKIAEKSLNVSQLTELVTNGRTEQSAALNQKTEKNLMPVSVWKKMKTVKRL